MKKYKAEGSLPVTELTFKAYQFKKGTGAVLSPDEEHALTEWADASEQHKILVERLTNGTFSDFNDWIRERHKITYYHHYVDYFFNGVHPEKIKRDNDIIWLMVECWYKKAIGPEAENLQEWANSSNVNKGIYDKFKEHIEHVEKSASLVLDTETAWKKYELNYVKGRAIIKIFLRGCKRIVGLR